MGLRANKTDRNVFILTLFLIILWVPSLANAQNFNQGLAYYQQKKYRKAASVFKKLHTLQGNLFSAKSLYATGEYRKAMVDLNKITPKAPAQLYLEAMYTTALIDFQRKSFGAALHNLQNIVKAHLDDNLSDKAKNLYQQILNYLAFSQRKQLLSGKYSDQIKFDALKTAVGKMTYPHMRVLYRSFLQHVSDKHFLTQSKQFKSQLSDSAAYNREYENKEQHLVPPKGTIYHIGVALPKYKPNDKHYDVVKALYFGVILAAKKYNNKHSRTRIAVHFVNTGAADTTMISGVKNFVNQNYGDALIGPLFSDQAKEMIALAGQFDLPVIAPLANKDIGADHTLVYQANPTFKVEGKTMAEYAVKTLGISRFTIMADKNSAGAEAAEAFRKEAKSLHAKINHYLVDKLQNQYQFEQYARYLGSSAIPIETIYAPFDNSHASTLIDLLLRKLRTLPRNVTVLGSQEWEKHQFHPTEDKNIDIYYSERTSPNNNQYLQNFKKAYRQQFKNAGNEYSMIGYDVARFIFRTLQKVGNPKLLPSVIAHQPPFHGLVKNIYFNGGNVNKAVSIRNVRKNSVEVYH